MAAFGGTVWAAVALLVALIIIVTIHEYGHYIVGRLCGIHAEVFSLGFGPALWGRTDRHGTRWQISAIPLGGYVKFLGDADAASRPDGAALVGLSDAERRHTMPGAPLWARAATVAAGPFFNFALTLVLFVGLVLWNGVAVNEAIIGKVRTVPHIGEALQVGDQILSINGIATPDMKTVFDVAETLPPDPTVTYLILRAGVQKTIAGPNPMPPIANEVLPQSAAVDAGLAPGDVILRANGKDIATFTQLKSLTEATNGAPILLNVWRDGATFEVTLTPRKRDLPNAAGGFDTRWMIGLSGGVLFEPQTRPAGAFEAVDLAWSSTWLMAKTNLSAIKNIANGSISKCNVSGAIGMAKAAGYAAKQGLESFVQLIALISLGIGLVNLFPIPVLDGGHLVFHAWEAITRRAPNEKVLGFLMTLGLAAVIVLMVFGLSNDVLCQ